MSFRIEKKFRVEQKKLVQLYSWLNKNKALKIYNDRYIKSIYFDNNKFSSYHDSIEGIVPRKKIRLRNYFKDKSDFDNLKLEIKINSIEGRYKTSEKLKTYNNYLNNGIHDNFYGICYPKIIVSYKREYYKVYGYRITVDREIEYDNFNLKNFFFNTINENRIIMELKTNFNSSENDINEKFPFEIIRFSKYCFGVEKLYKNLISG
tara:strand:- start:198 stop:815 length:618 start_codon:yes stop_codon:yes gene_type:complete